LVNKENLIVSLEKLEILNPKLFLSCLFLIILSELVFASSNTESNMADHGIFGGMIELITDWIANYGYPSVFAAALLENLFPPIPSELVFPLIGFTAQTNDLGIAEVIGMAIIGAVGSTVGAIIIYYIALKLGLPAITRIGKRYHLISESDIKKTETWFARHGELAVFLGRMAPGIRELISIPAGIAGMNILKFTFFTFIGSSVWSIILTLIGFFIGDAWIRFYGDYSQVFDIAGISLILAIGAILALRYYKKKRN
jgi:membrane protein DedA with SNARE-associated domain